MSSAANAGVPEHGPGIRLRQAREAADLEVAEVAAAMRVPVRVVQSLETEDWDRLGAAVFLRGHLRSYARAVGLPEDALQPEDGTAPVTPTRLEPRNFTPRYRRLAEQAARRMVYVVITATLVVPVWMVTRGHIEGSPAEIASLDLQIEPAATGNNAPAASPTEQRQRPFVASMTPIQARRAPALTTAPEKAADAPALLLRFSGDSWIEVLGPDGAQLEQALVTAGGERSYGADEIGRVVLGNAAAVEVSRFGDIQDIEPFQRANVARFTVSSDGSLAPVGD